jgi:predicted CXXCH cytochrome family protein
LWESGQALGLCAVAGCLALCVLAVRPRSGASTAFALRGHEFLGWLVLAAAVLHVALLLGADRRVIQHLKLTAPRYEYAGVLALVSLLLLTVPAGAALRARIWRRHRAFQATHVAIACLLLLTLAVHVVGTERYVRGRAHVVAYLLLSGMVLFALLRARRQRPPAAPQASPSGSLVFGRHSRLVAAIIAASLVLLAVLSRGGTALALREPFVQRAQALAVDFPHERHRMVECVQCHHNFTDATGSGSCFSCHRSARADLRVGPEARFHDFCLGCHRDPPAELSGHGPVTGCEACHAVR